MNKHSRQKLLVTASALAAAAGMSLGTGPAQAFTTNYSCASGTSGFCTLQDLFSGGSITVDENMDGRIDKEFSGWTLGDVERLPTSNPPGNRPPIPNFNNIQVRAFDAGDLNVGLDYQVLNDALKLNPSGTSAGGGQLTQTLRIPYSFAVESFYPIRLTDNKLNLTQATTTGAAGTTASVTILERVTATSGEELGSKLVTQDRSGASIPNDIIQFPNQEVISVDTILELVARSASTTNRAVAQLTQFKQTFSQTQIPEPGTVLGLLAVGGLGLAMKRKQQGN